MRLKYHFVFEHVGNIILGIVVGDDVYKYRRFLKFNECGYDVVKHLTNNHTPEDLVCLFLEEYDVDKTTAISTVDSVIKYLIDSKAVIE